MSFGGATLSPPGKEPGPAYLFLPRRFQRGKWLRWLKRTHAWLAFWGGVAGLLFGLTGFLLNHREIMKVPAVSSQQQAFSLPLVSFRPENQAVLGQWIQTQLAWPNPPSRSSKKAAAPAPWGEGKVMQPERWEFVFSSPQRQVNAEYWVGESQVLLTQRQGNAFYWLTRLHMASGVHPGWVLAADVVAGCLVALTLTGLLLWTRLHGSRLLALGLGSASVAVLAFFAWLS